MMTDAALHVGPEFPVPDFDDLTVALGAPHRAYLTAEQMGRDHYSGRHPMNKVASSLFFNGGSLAGHGLCFKPGIDRTKAMRAIKALLCSFEPPHEIKEGTVGYALSQWCESAPAPEPVQTPHQAQRKKKRKGKVSVAAMESRS